MATAKKPETEERVELYVERGQANDDPNAFVGVNGVNYLLPRGKTSMVPKAVYDEYMRGREAQEAYDDLTIGMTKAAQAPQ